MFTYLPEDLKLSQIGSSPLPPPFRGLHSPGVRKHCQIIFACCFQKSSITRMLGDSWPTVGDSGHCSCVCVTSFELELPCFFWVLIWFGLVLLWSIIYTGEQANKYLTDVFRIGNIWAGCLDCREWLIWLPFEYIIMNIMHSVCDNLGLYSGYNCITVI